MTGFSGFPDGALARPPFSVLPIKFPGQGASGPAKAYAALFSRHNAFRLPLADITALIFCDKGQNLQDHITDKGAHQIPAPARVQ